MLKTNQRDRARGQGHMASGRKGKVVGKNNSAMKVGMTGKYESVKCKVMVSSGHGGN